MTPKNGYRKTKKFACEHPEKFEYEACGFCLAKAYELLERALLWECGRSSNLPNWAQEAKVFLKPQLDYKNGTRIRNKCIDCGKPVQSGNICLPCVRVRYPRKEGRKS